MSDEPTVIEAIKKRNEELKVVLDAAAPTDEHVCPKSLNYIRDDIDTLLSEIASRDAEIERLRAPAHTASVTNSNGETGMRWCCTAHADAHTPK